MDRESATERIPLASSEDLRVRWRGLALIFDEPTLNRLVALLAERIPEIEDLKVHVTPGELAVTAMIHRFGVPLSAKATLSQLRLKDGFLAFVLDKVQALSFIPIPDQLLSYLVQRAVRWGNMPLESWLQDVIKDESVLFQLRQTLGFNTVSAETNGGDNAV